MSISKILIIDDSKSDQFIARVAIEELDENVEIFEAKDGLQAIEILQEGHKPDIILLDINMPKMNGFEFLNAYSKFSEQKISTVVMLTSSEQERDKEQAESFHFVKDYILKPIDLSKLISVVKNVVEGK